MFCHVGLIRPVMAAPPLPRWHTGAVAAGSIGPGLARRVARELP